MDTLEEVLKFLSERYSGCKQIKILDSVPDIFDARFTLHTVSFQDCYPITRTFHVLVRSNRYFELFFSDLFVLLNSREVDAIKSCKLVFQQKTSIGQVLRHESWFESHPTGETLGEVHEKTRVKRRQIEGRYRLMKMRAKVQAQKQLAIA